MFEEGKSGNPNGRPKGAENKETKKIRLWINQFLDDNTSTIEEDLKLVKPNERLQFITGLLEYSIPKLARVENINDHDGQLTIKVVRESNESNTQYKPQESSSSTADDIKPEEAV